MKRIILAIIVMCLMAMFVLADTSNKEYTVTVLSQSNIIITSLDLDFSNCLAGASCTDITYSLQVQNNGNREPDYHITGNFLYGNDTLKGLNETGGGDDVIPGDNFTLNGTRFTDDGASVIVCYNDTLPPGVNTSWEATLEIPKWQAAGVYNGTILLNWTA